jgi:hypothetical protein
MIMQRNIAVLLGPAAQVWGGGQAQTVLLLGLGTALASVDLGEQVKRGEHGRLGVVARS